MKKHLIAITSILFLSLCLAIGTNIAKANPSYTALSVQTATATTTASFIGVGTGTTTLMYDSYTASNTCGATTLANYTIADQATILTQLAASSTSSVLGIAVEYSNDCVDWYQDSVNVSTTTTPTALVNNLNAVNTFTWIAPSTATTSKAVLVKTPTRYMRVKYSLTGAAGAVWGQIIPAKQRPE